ncbi:MAG: molybdopterin cofactor-binding domain-containing protein, partial [Sphingomonadales bacterium]
MGGAFDITRRGFIKGAGGLTFAIGASGLLAACASEDDAAGLVEFQPNLWATIASDGKITVMGPAAEMGQGSLTSLPLIFAEELDADWKDINPVQVSIPHKIYGNPYFGGLLYTGGSRAVADYYKTLRLAGAQARRLLMMAAAGRWKVPLGELATEPGFVVHTKSKKRLSYGEIAAFAKVPKELPEIKESELKDPKNFRLIGHDTPRTDIPSKVNGTAQYAMDVQVPGMVYASILHAPVEGESPVDIDDAKTLKVPGVTHVVALENAVAVIGKTVEATRFGKDVLEVTWTGKAEAQGFDSEKNLAACSAAANDLSQKGVPWREVGDTYAALETADKVISAEYHCDFVYHAQMEPLNATALVNKAGDGADIWSGTQSQTLTTLAAARELGTTPDKIKLHQMFLGGGFGRRAEFAPTYTLQAIQLSKKLGKPVKVIWSREDDLTNGWFRPSTAQLMRAGLDKDGKVVAWNHRMAGPSVLEFYNIFRWGIVKDQDVISMLGSDIPNYAIPNILAEHVMLGRISRLSPWRGVATGYTKFAVESFVDELA